MPPGEVPGGAVTPPGREPAPQMPAPQVPAPQVPAPQVPTLQVPALRGPAVPGILTADDVLATGHCIAAGQQRAGAIGWPDGHCDAWNHVECAMALSACGLTEAARRAYDWLRVTQRPDGSWPKKTVGDVVTDSAAESNQVAYVAVGTWHEFQVTGDEEFVRQMWPTVRRAIEFALALQTARGEIVWKRAADGTPASYALLTGCSSTHQSLRTGRGPARARGGVPPGGVRRQERVLDGLVLPGPGRAGARAGGGRAPGRGLARIRRAGSGRAVRQRSAVGYRGGNV
jgi:hypothetical protein